MVASMKSYTLTQGTTTGRTDTLEWVSYFSYTQLSISTSFKTK